MIDKKRILRYVVLSAMLLFIMALLSQTIGLSAGGFDSDEILTQFFFYIGPGIAFLLGILLLFVAGIIITKDDVKYGYDSLAFADQGEKPAFSLFKDFTSLQILILSIIFFSILGILTFSIKQESFTGLRMLEQQFTIVGSVLFSSTLIPISENLGASFLIALSLFGLRFYARKKNLSSANFTGFAYFIILLVGIYGVANHSLRYSGSDIALWTVFLFWAFGAVMTLITGSFIPFLVMHATNNLFIDLGRFFSNENLFIYFGIYVFILIVIYALLYKGRYFGSTKIQ